VHQVGFHYTDSRVSQLETWNFIQTYLLTYHSPPPPPPTHTHTHARVGGQLLTDSIQANNYATLEVSENN